MMKHVHYALDLAAEHGYTFVHPFDDPDGCNRTGNDRNGDL